MIACYCWVSTAEQNLDRQLESTSEFTKGELGADLASIQTFRDKSTGTDTSREGYQELMARVNGGDVEHVVVHEISRMARSLPDLEQTVSRVTEGGAAVHLV